LAERAQVHRRNATLRNAAQRRERVVVCFTEDDTYMVVSRKEIIGDECDLHCGREVLVTYDKLA
jgi:hypothetical protein